jgi:phosphoglucomutase
MINKNIIGKQYGCRSSALRAIRNFKLRYFVSIPRGFQFFVNRIDEGCFEICSN